MPACEKTPAHEVEEMKVLDLNGRFTVEAKLHVYKEYLTMPLLFQLLNGHLMTE